MTENIANPSEIRKSKKRHRHRRAQETLDMQDLLKQKKFRDFVWRLLRQCNVYRGSYMGNVNDCVHREGSRVVGLYIHDEIISADPGALVQMMMEHKANEQPVQKEIDDE